ncbi:MAG TPA: FAD-dependent oxidoreductase [Vicinamibacterales bacterium]|nr:FAD-dependent oxidoreductase [Vicinamibacterales bacterium]
MRPVYGLSPWIDRFPKSRVPSYPKYRGDLDIDVAIIGAGLTGCATAYAFAAAGISVAVFEADRIGRGSSGASAGWITDEPSVGFARVDAALGRRNARHAWQAWRRAALDFEALIRRLDLKCHAEARPSLLVARTGEDAATLGREHKARADAGVDGALVPARSIGAVAGFPAASGLRSRESATIDPYRATLGLASAAVKRGARIFERSAVTNTTFDRNMASLSIGADTVRARRIVVATGVVPSLFKPLARHVTARTAFLVLTEPVPARVRKGLGSRDHLLRDTADPPHRIAWLDDERMLVCGADGEPVPERTREATLVQRTGQLMYELSTFYPEISGLQPAYGWDAPYASTASGLPVIGPHRNFPHHLFAFGDGGHSLTGAYLASRVLLRHHLEDTQAADDVFGFAR